MLLRQLLLFLSLISLGYLMLPEKSHSQVSTYSPPLGYPDLRVTSQTIVMNKFLRERRKEVFHVTGNMYVLNNY